VNADPASVQLFLPTNIPYRSVVLLADRESHLAAVLPASIPPKSELGPESRRVIHGNTREVSHTVAMVELIEAEESPTYDSHE